MFKLITIQSAIFLCFSTVTFAQTDSSSYDLGRVSVKKEFTQSITIKGSDLEHYQFSNLADAIKVWFYGTYSNPSTLLYVVDGNIITDVNAYSIYDIDEITLVQNALAQVGGANADQQMVLIKLKTNRPGKKGVEVNGQTSFVNLKNPPNSFIAASAAGFYNQYYVTAYHNGKNVNLGVSAEYQRDVLPGVIMPNIVYNPYTVISTYNYNSFVPSNFIRIKLNTYLKADLGKGNSLNLRMNYTPQALTNNSNYNVVRQYDNFVYNYANKNNSNQNVLNLNLSLTNRILTGFNNSFSISLNNFNTSLDSTSNRQDFLNNKLYDNSSESDKFNESLSILLIQDNLSYKEKWGNIHLDACINFSYRKVHDSLFYGTNTTQVPLAGDSYFGEPYNSVSSGSNYTDYKLYYITPSLNIYYKNIVNFQAGFVDILNSNKDFITNEKVDRFFPFVSTTLNVGKLLGNYFDNFSIFGSFSRKSQLLADGYSTLTDFSISNNTPITNSFQLAGPNGLMYEYYGSNASSPYASYNSFQTGIIINLTKNFTLNYSFEYSYYKALGISDFNLASVDVVNRLYYFDDKVVSNRIGLNYTLKLTNLTWKVGLNASEFRLKLANTGEYLNTAGKNSNTTDNNSNDWSIINYGNENQINSNGYPIITPTTGSNQIQYLDNYYTTNLDKGYRWSGGFTNRISCKSFFAGMDVLYQIGERPYYIYNLNTSTTPVYNPTPLNNNSFSLQNLYIGEQIKITKLNYAEIYLNGRNILQNNSSTITDNRRYFGAGFKVAL